MSNDEAYIIPRGRCSRCKNWGDPATPRDDADPFRVCVLRQQAGEVFNETLGSETCRGFRSRVTYENQLRKEASCEPSK